MAAAALAAPPAELQTGRPSTNSAIFSQTPPFPTREVVAMATIDYAAAHERVFSDYQHEKRKTETSYLHSYPIYDLMEEKQPKVSLSAVLWVWGDGGGPGASKGFKFFFSFFFFTK